MKTNFTAFNFFFFLLFSGMVYAQTEQVVRGTVVDNITESPIQGAKVIIVNSEPALRVVTDENGQFKFPKVSIGRHTIVASYYGYKDAILKGIIVNAGKETVLEIQLEEEIVDMKEIKVVGNKDKPLNEMSVVSTRTFSVEETQKYAAAMNDPARMATSFAGVVATQGINNDISIRGNAPRGIIWRMEGIEIPNPNHFSSVGTSGGGISIISAQLMGNSDFSTGAFAAEYGNALSGVFDLTLRKGNNEKREYTIQAGVLGIDAAMEGPFKKGYRGSYLINYRYSTLGVLSQIVPIGDNVTTFQDISFNVFLPTKKAGNFGIFGFGGLSDDSSKSYEDTTVWSIEYWKQYQSVFTANTGVVGAWHKIRFGENGFLRTNLAISGTQNGNGFDSLDYSFYRHSLYEESYTQKKLTTSTNYIHKLSPKSNLRTGIIFNQIGFDLTERMMINGKQKESIAGKGATQTLQGYFQLQHKFTEKLTVNTGLHYVHLLLNNTKSLEPRASVSYIIKQKHQLALGYGLHGQVQPLGTYFSKTIDANGNVLLPNKDLDLSKAHHLVLSYNWAINPNHRVHVEAYYQHLYNVPVSATLDSTFSMLNSPDGFESSTLFSDGLGRNYGLEVSFERSLKEGLYYLVAGSIYESKYQAINKEWFDTRYNTKYSMNITAGKDWTLKNKEKRRVLGVNFKSVLTGGMRFTPYDESTLASGNPSYDNSRSFGEDMPAYYRLDFRISLKRDFKKMTSVLALDLQNVMNRKNVGGQYFDTNTLEVAYWHHPGLLPVLSWRLNF